MLEIPPQLAFYVWIPIFFVFSFVMKTLIFDPTQRLLDGRAERTTGAQEEAEKMRDEVADMKDRFDQQLAEARLAGNTAGEKVRRDAESREREIIQAARTEATRLGDEVRARIAAETDQARSSLQSDTADLAKLVADKVLGRAESH